MAAPRTPARPRTLAGERMAEPGQKARVLPAKEHTMIRELLGTVLAEAGHQVTLARNGAEAIRALEDSDFDLVVMDLQMPEMGGIAATRRIRGMEERVRDIPIVILTAHALPEDAELCRAVGANEYLA